MVALIFELIVYFVTWLKREKSCVPCMKFPPCMYLGNPSHLLPVSESVPSAYAPPLFPCFCPQPLPLSLIVKFICQILVASSAHVCYITSVVSDSLRPYGQLPARLLCPWDSPGNNPGVGCHPLLQRIFLTQRSNLRLCTGRQVPYH